MIQLFYFIAGLLLSSNVLFFVIVLPIIKRMRELIDTHEDYKRDVKLELSRMEQVLQIYDISKRFEENKELLNEPEQKA